ncbi:unnamed protein product [Prorocentrum cordatum]|uniref:1,3-beta-glucan synthase n=2 Tax=Prorocentrum cordatum TaxID=2364126 RepID=A0ABN9XTW1_9DINO|nr:unnamed protein product [Polarella glacialis]
MRQLRQDVIQTDEDLNRRRELSHNNKALAVCARGTDWAGALALVSSMTLQALRLDQVSYNTAATACGNSTRWQAAISLLASAWRRLLPQDVVGCTAAISACEKAVHWQLALQRLLDMQRCSVRANVVTIGAVISACQKGQSPATALELLSSAPRVAGQISRQAFGAAVAACETGAFWALALDLLVGATNDRTRPDGVSLVAALGACARRHSRRAAGHLVCRMELWARRWSAGATPARAGEAAAVAGALVWKEERQQSRNATLQSSFCLLRERELQHGDRGDRWERRGPSNMYQMSFRIKRLQSEAGYTLSGAWHAYCRHLDCAKDHRRPADSPADPYRRNPDDANKFLADLADARHDVTLWAEWQGTPVDWDAAQRAAEYRAWSGIVPPWRPGIYFELYRLFAPLVLIAVPSLLWPQLSRCTAMPSAGLQVMPFGKVVGFYLGHSPGWLVGPAFDALIGRRPTSGPGFDALFGWGAPANQPEALAAAWAEPDRLATAVSPAGQCAAGNAPGGGFLGVAAADQLRNCIGHCSAASAAPLEARRGPATRGGAIKIKARPPCLKLEKITCYHSATGKGGKRDSHAMSKPESDSEGASSRASDTRAKPSAASIVQVATYHFLRLHDEMLVAVVERMMGPRGLLHSLGLDDSMHVSITGEVCLPMTLCALLVPCAVVGAFVVPFYIIYLALWASWRALYLGQRFCEHERVVRWRTVHSVWGIGYEKVCTAVFTGMVIIFAISTLGLGHWEIVQADASPADPLFGRSASVLKKLIAVALFTQCCLWSLFGLDPGSGSYYRDDDEAGDPELEEVEHFDGIEVEPSRGYSDYDGYTSLYYDDVEPMAWKKWNRVYLLTDVAGRRGMTALVIDPVEGEPGTYTIVDPTGRVQTKDLRDKQKVFTRPRAGIDWAPFPGVTGDEKKELEDESLRIRRRRGAGWGDWALGRKKAAAKLKPKAAAKTGKGRKSNRSNMVYWIAENAFTTGVAVWTHRTFGVVGLGCLVAYKAWSALGIGDLVSSSIERVREVGDLFDDMDERYQSIRTKYDDGDYDLAIIALGLLFILLLVFWPTVRSRRARGRKWSRIGDETDSDSSSPDEGTAASDSDEDSLRGGPDGALAVLLSSQASLQSQMDDLKKLIKSGASSSGPTSSTMAAAGSASSAPAPPGGSPADEADVKTGIDSLLHRLREREGAVERDAGEERPEAAAGLGATSAARGSPKESIQKYLTELERESDNPRLSMLEQLKKFQITDWKIGPSEARIAPKVLSRLYRHNTTATFQVKEYIKSKEMSTSHVAGELRLLAAILDRMVATKFEMINSEAVEVICRRIYGLFRAWEQVSKMSDWKQPKGEGGKKWPSALALHVLELTTVSFIIGGVGLEPFFVCLPAFVMARARARDPLGGVPRSGIDELERLLEGLGECHGYPEGCDFEGVESVVGSAGLGAAPRWQGDLCPLVVENVAVPPGDTEPVDLCAASPTARPYLSCPLETMIKNDLEDVVDQVEFEGGSARVQTASAAPQFPDFGMLHWLFIDDYGGMRLERKGLAETDLEVSGDLDRIKKKLGEHGLDSHKERFGHGLERTLGVTLSEHGHLHIVEEKMKDLVLIGEFLLTAEVAPPRGVESWLGLATWAMMCARSALSIPHAIYAWVLQFRDATDAPLWGEVKDEISAIVSLSIFFFTDLTAGWHDWAFMSDASSWGYGVVASKANLHELRAEARLSEMRGWATSIEDEYSRVEEEAFAQQGLDAEADEHQQCRESRPTVKRDLAPGEVDYGSAARIGRSRKKGFRTEEAPRLLIHKVDDNTNWIYVNWVSRFLRAAQKDAIPLDTIKQRDAAMAQYLSFMCYTLQLPHVHGGHLLSGFAHIFPEHKDAMPLSARALKSWEALRMMPEGKAICREIVALMILKLIDFGYIMSAIAVLYSYDIFGREQDWYLLRGSDVISDGDQVAVRLGSRERGEMVKTGANQGLLIASPYTAAIVETLARSVPGDGLVFALTTSEYRRHWGKAALSLGAIEYWQGIEGKGPKRTINPRVTRDDTDRYEVINCPDRRNFECRSDWEREQQAVGNMLRDRPPLRVAQHRAELMKVMERFGTDPTLPRDAQMTKVSIWFSTALRHSPYWKDGFSRHFEKIRTFDPYDGWVVVDDLLTNWTENDQWKGYREMHEVLIKGRPHTSYVYWVLLNCCEMIDNHGMQKGRLQMKCVDDSMLLPPRPH